MQTNDPWIHSNRYEVLKSAVQWFVRELAWQDGKSPKFLLHISSWLCSCCSWVREHIRDWKNGYRSFFFFIPDFSVCSSSTRKRETRLALRFLWLVRLRFALLMNCYKVHSFPSSAAQICGCSPDTTEPRLPTTQPKKKLHLWLKTPLASQFSCTNKTGVNMTSKYATAVKIWDLFVYY